jgi:protein-S-isoprenylcysteine O-methyltransferase Ste14
MRKSLHFGPILIASALLIAQYILAFFVFGLTPVKILQWLGWLVWLVSLYFGIAPIFIFRKRGGVSPGSSYVHTTQLVDRGLYGLVRHPQYLAGIWFSLALMLLSLHWLVITLGLLSIGLLYLDIRNADQEGLEKFGERYRDYMQKVPRANIFLGLWRWVRRRT